MIDGSPQFKVPPYQGEDYTTSTVYEHLCELFRDQGTQDILDGQDATGDNIRRAKFAAEAVRTYAKETRVYEGENIFLAISDLMSDLRHLLDFVALADDDTADGYPTDLETMAARDVHYEAEIRGEF